MRLAEAVDLTEGPVRELEEQRSAIAASAKAETRLARKTNEPSGTKLASCTSAVDTPPPTPRPESATSRRRPRSERQ
jgi:hypothetical protein